MKVKELIALLDVEDQELEVVVRGYEDGVESVKAVQLREVAWLSNANPDKTGDYETGEHEYWDSTKKGHEKKSVLQIFGRSWL